MQVLLMVSMIVLVTYFLESFLTNIYGSLIVCSVFLHTVYYGSNIMFCVFESYNFDLLLHKFADYDIEIRRLHNKLVCVTFLKSFIVLDKISQGNIEIFDYIISVGPIIIIINYQKRRVSFHIGNAIWILQYREIRKINTNLCILKCTVAVNGKYPISINSRKQNYYFTLYQNLYFAKSVANVIVQMIFVIKILFKSADLL